MSDKHEHFKGKDALNHVVEGQARAIIASAEVHGVEVPGPLSAGADAGREAAVLLLLLWGVLVHLNVGVWDALQALAIFALALATWKIGRAAWLGYSRLERLHRIIAEERWEIEHHRSQEREELKELYAAKGFQGKLLEDVLDVLMADGDRLLRVMLEEELGFSLNVHDHPLKQGLGAFLGVLAASLCLLFGLWLSPSYGILVAGVLTIGSSAALSAYFEKNRLIPSIVWNIGLGGLTLAVGICLLDFVAAL